MENWWMDQIDGKLMEKWMNPSIFVHPFVPSIFPIFSCNGVHDPRSPRSPRFVFRFVSKRRGDRFNHQVTTQEPRKTVQVVNPTSPGQP